MYPEVPRIPLLHIGPGLEEVLTRVLKGSGRATINCRTYTHEEHETRIVVGAHAVMTATNGNSGVTVIVQEVLKQDDRDFTLVVSPAYPEMLP